MNGTDFSNDLVAESPAAPLLRFLLAPLEPWLNDGATEELCINRPGECWVRQRGVFERFKVPLDRSALEDIAVLAGALRRQDVGPTSPLCSTELPGGERLQICLPPAVPTGTVSLTIRRPGSTVAPLSSVTSRYQSDGWNSWAENRDTRNFAEALDYYDSGDLEGFLAAAVRCRTQHSPGRLMHSSSVAPSFSQGCSGASRKRSSGAAGLSATRSWENSVSFIVPPAFWP